MIMRNARGDLYDVAVTWEELPEGDAKIDEIVQQVGALIDRSDSSERRMLAAAVVTLAETIRSTPAPRIALAAEAKTIDDTV